jgi:two-component system, NarL family, response regulator YdfI
MIRVLIKAPTPVARAGLESLIGSYPNLQVIGEDADQLETLNTDHYPDVIVAEVDSHDDRRIRQLLHEAAGGPPLIVLVRDPAVEWGAMFRHGVRGALSSNASGEQIALAIEAAAAGLAVFHADEADHLFGPAMAHEPLDSLPEALTSREIEILRFLAEGLENKEIASQLGISEHTVKFHVASIMGKLGVSNRTEAVMSGIRHGLVPI